ncbi:MAG: hypothetical protein JRF60_17970 [Deltaproteobacteria bacterium]|nr:hypothetical protein [Deltaproteobacteria bacterium]
MTIFNEQKYNVEVKKRLDEIFSYETKINKTAKKTHKMMYIYPLYTLKNILLSIEWEVTDDILSKYLNEIIQLQRLFQNNRYLKRLLQIQYFYGRFIKTYPDRIPLRTYKILYTLYDCMKNLLANKKLSDFEKKKIVEQEIHRYKNFRKYLRINKNNLSEDRSYKNSTKKRYKISQNKDSKNVMNKIKIIVQDELTYKRYMDSNLLEMKTFIKKEIKKLKYELFSLQPKLTND